MLDVVTDIAEADIDYQRVFMLVGVYLGTLWVMFCIWVFVDARKRYRNIFVAFIFFLIVLLFNFPALIFYLIIRPELEDWIEVMGGGGEDHYPRGGVQVPIVHFTGEDGRVEMSLNLNLHPKKHTDNDMVIDVKWDSAKESLKVAGQQQSQQAAMPLNGTSAVTKEKSSRSVSSLLTGHVNRFRSGLEKARAEREQKTTSQSGASLTPPAQQSNAAQRSGGHQKSKKRK